MIALVIAILMMSILGAGIYSLTTSSSFSQILANGNDNAYELARAGLRYAAAYNQNLTTQQTFYMPDSNHLFQVSIAAGTITSTGIVNQGTFWEASRTLTYVAPPYQGLGISFQNDMPSFSSPNTGGSSGGSAIQANMANNSLNLGGNVTNSYGSDWYQGSSIAGYCINGACNFGAGLNVYFDFTFLQEDYSANSTNSADGFTFAVMSAINNARNLTGGAPANYYSMGELMGYAGPGNSPDGLGLKPPKIALQFDTYPNAVGNFCTSPSRNDASSFIDNVSLMFWGARTPTPSGGNCVDSTTGSSYPNNSFDDNVHGAGGTGTDPQNNTGSGDAGYYQFTGLYPGTCSSMGCPCLSSANTCNWMEDGYTYSARMEIVRPSSPGGSDSNGTYYNYQIKAWIVRQDLQGFSRLQAIHFQNPTVPFSDIPAQINKTVKIYNGPSGSPQDHNDFSKIFFGFTEATGAATQQVTLANFQAFFPQSTCTAPIPTISVGAANYSAAGGSGSVTVNATCPWQASSTVSWITITSGSSGATNGTVNYTVAANAGPARTGYIDISGPIFTVTQDSGCPALFITTASLPNAIKNQTYSATVTAGGGVTPYSWTAGGLPAGLSIGSSSGTISGTPIATGTYTPTITVTDSCPQSVSSTYTISSGCPALSITTASLPNAIKNQSYSTPVTASGGVTPYSWTASGLPAGLSINPSSGTISGTPTATGTYTPTITVTDNCPQSVPRSYTMGSGCPALSITTASLPNGTPNVNYNATVSASGGTGAYTWGLAAGTTLPPGLTLNSSTGAISGRPTTAGTYTPTINVTDQCPQTVSNSYTIQILPPSPTCTLTPTPSNIVAYNGTTGLTWTVTNSPTSATWTISPGGTCGSANLLANGSCTTGSLTTPGANTYTLTVANAGGSNQCSATVYVGCQGYRVWDNYDNNARPFLVTGGTCVTGLTSGHEITNGTPQLKVNGTVTRYSSGSSNCSATGRPSISYTTAMDADIAVNGGNGNCQVNYSTGDTATDR